MDPDVIAVFDFDYEKIESFNKEVQWTAMCCFPPALLLSAPCCTPCFLAQNVEWSTRAQHLAITVDGIKFVKDKRKTLCGLQCSDAGKESKTVPFDKLTDCDVTEPAGNACVCCIENILYTVNVDTASSGQVSPEGVVRHELSLVGLKRPLEFKRAVWAMKRGGIVPGLSPEAQHAAREKMKAHAR